MTTPIADDLTPTTPMASPSHSDIHNILSRIISGPMHENVQGYGADPSGATDSSSAIQAAIDAMGSIGGTVYIPPGRYKVDATIEVPSRTRVVGAGRWATKLFASSAFINAPMFETVAPTAAYENMFGQAYGITLEGFTIEDEDSDDTYLVPTGRSADHHGIYFHDVDWSLIRDVWVRDLAGYGLTFGNEVRECVFQNSEIYNCGDSGETVPAFDMYADSGDATNTCYFLNSRFIYSNYIGVYIHGAHSEGPRLNYFVQCQFEGGGNGSAGTLGTPFPYDIIKIDRMRDVYFIGCNWSLPGENKFCVNVHGDATFQPLVVGFDHCSFNGGTYGGGIRANLVDNITVNDSIFTTMTAEEADFYVEAAAGTVWIGLDTFFDTNEFAGSYTGHIRGKISNTGFIYEDVEVFQRNLWMDGTRTKIQFRGDVDDNKWRLGGYSPNGDANPLVAILTPYDLNGSLPSNGSKLLLGGHGDFESSKVMLKASGGMKMVAFAGIPTDSGLGISSIAEDGLIAYDETNHHFWFRRQGGTWQVMPGQVIQRNISTSFSNSAAENTLFTATVPANYLGTDRMVEFVMVGEILNNTGGALTPTLRVKFGGTTFAEDTLISLAANASRRLFVVRGHVWANGATNSQHCFAQVHVGSPSTATTGVGAFDTAATLDGNGISNTLGIDSTAARDIVITFQFAAASANAVVERKTAYARLVG